MAEIRRIQCLPLPDPRDGELSIRLLTGATSPPSGFAVHDYTVQFLFNPQYELESLDRAFFFFSAKLEAYSGLDPRLGRQIAREMGQIAYNYVNGLGWRYGLSMSTELETVRAAEEEQGPPAPAECILGNMIFDDGDQNSEFCCVCWEEFLREEVITQLSLCLHKFHNECLAKWLQRNRTCPICRGRV